MPVTKVDSFYAKHPIIGNPEMSVESAYQIMQKSNIRHLPVLIDQKIVGIVSERDLFRALNLEFSKDIRVEDVMTSNPYVAQRGTPLLDIVREMIATKAGSTIIVDKKNDIVGIFTTIDALAALEQFLQDENDEEYDQLLLDRYDHNTGWSTVLS